VDIDSKNIVYVILLTVFSELDWFVTIIKVVALVFGAYIVYLAYEGYRRNSSRPLLFVALGFALITGATVIEGILYVVIAPLRDPISNLLLALLASTTITLIGFIAIIYSVYSAK
jgi:hypothetical protein